ncbi:MFS transporter [Thermoproteus tenax]|uniref:Predicted permease of the major facilitator superfamily n=1 Tax=Thermoproteus tenax (strain ATCC 35583 / DSM 2078 / JCM 9277 / NBRC 100435 / Kra 1) TaxID=768679 RepID=G4RKC9_THETK|nr:MFS transporter [Thermoproteus tenax]CCC82024.1 predicted permease of the major facilitator superfamily [Thermoproteus tenax Kra 1]
MRRGGRLGLVSLIVSLTIAARSVNYMVQSTVPPFARELGLGPAEVGLLAATGAAGQLISTVFLNVVLGPEQRRKAFVLSATAVPFLLAAFALSGPVSLWPAVFAAGLVFGIIMPNLINLPSLSPQSAERLLAIYSLSLSISLVVGPAYETAVLAKYSYRYVFLFFLPLALLLAVLSRKAAFPPSRAEGSLKRLYARALSSAGFLSSVLSITAYNVPFMALVTYLPIYASEQLGLPNALAYSLFIPFFSVSMATRLYMSLRPVRDLVKAFVASVALTLAGLVLLWSSSSYATIAAAMALLGVPHGSVFTLSTIMIARTTPVEERNAVNSLFSSYLVILGIAVPPALGALAEAWGFRSMWLSLLLPTAIASGAFLALFGRSERLRRPT